MEEKPKIPVDIILKHLAEDADKAQDRAQKASEVLLGPLETAIATTPYEVIYQEDRVKLKHYLPMREAIQEITTPLLVVYALINRETMLDLQPERSVVKNFLEAGIDLYMIDWGYPSRKDKFLTIDDHVNGYMDNIVDYIRRPLQGGQDQSHGHLHGRHLLRDLFGPPPREGQKPHDHGIPHQL